MQLLLFIYYVCKRDQGEHLARMKLLQETVVCFWMVLVVYLAIIAMMSLSYNDLMDKDHIFVGSIALSLFMLLAYSIYLLVWVRPYRLFELYKMQNCLRVAGLALLPINRYAGVVLLNMIDVIMGILDLALYRH